MPVQAILYGIPDGKPEDGANVTPERSAQYFIEDDFAARGGEVVIESGMGEASQHTDEAYTEVGVTVSSDRDKELSEADLQPDLDRRKLRDQRVRQ